MHAEVYKFVADCIRSHDLAPRKTILEIGGRNINGSVRPLFGFAAYTSIDLVDGPGVDVVADAITFTPVKQPDTVVCCEVLEHAKNWEKVIDAAAGVLGKDGILIITCATDPRLPHSAVDGGQLREDEYYGNVDHGNLLKIVEGVGLTLLFSEVDESVGDLRMLAVKQ